MGTSLYERLGGEAGIHKMVEDVIGAHLVNPIVRARFEAAEDIEHAKKMAREFFGAGSGGPVTYTGQDMRTAHTGMNITGDEFAAVREDIMNVADSHNLDAETKAEVAGIVDSLKAEIVGV